MKKNKKKWIMIEGRGKGVREVEILSNNKCDKVLTGGYDKFRNGNKTYFEELVNKKFIFDTKEEAMNQYVRWEVYYLKEDLKELEGKFISPVALISIALVINTVMVFTIINLI